MNVVHVSHMIYNTYRTVLGILFIFSESYLLDFLETIIITVLIRDIIGKFITQLIPY